MQLSPVPQWSSLVVGVLLALLCLGGCSAQRELSQTPRTTIEQLLIAQSIERSLSKARMPLEVGETVSVDARGLSADNEFGRAIVTRWMREQGLHVRYEETAYKARVIFHALGTSQAETFFGIPELQSTFIPLALPELSFYKSRRQHGYSRFQIEISDRKTGELVHLTPIYEGTVHFNLYTVLLGFAFESTNVMPPPPLQDESI